MGFILYVYGIKNTNFVEGRSETAWGMLLLFRPNDAGMNRLQVCPIDIDSGHHSLLSTTQIYL